MPLSENTISHYFFSLWPRTRATCWRGCYKSNEVVKPSCLFLELTHHLSLHGDCCLVPNICQCGSTTAGWSCHCNICLWKSTQTSLQRRVARIKHWLHLIGWKVHLTQHRVWKTDFCFFLTFPINTMETLASSRMMRWFWRVGDRRRSSGIS